MSDVVELDPNQSGEELESKFLDLAKEDREKATEWRNWISEIKDTLSEEVRDEMKSNLGPWDLLDAVRELYIKPDYIKTDLAAYLENNTKMSRSTADRLITDAINVGLFQTRRRLTKSEKAELKDGAKSLEELLAKEGGARELYLSDEILERYEAFLQRSASNRSSIPS